MSLKSLFPALRAPVDIEGLVSLGDGIEAHLPMLQLVENLYLRRVLACICTARIQGMSSADVEPWLSLAPGEAGQLARSPYVTALVHHLVARPCVDEEPVMQLLVELPRCIKRGHRPGELDWRGSELLPTIEVATRDGIEMRLAANTEFLRWASVEAAQAGYLHRTRPSDLGEIDIATEALMLVEQVWPSAAAELGKVLTHLIVIDPALRTTGATSHRTRGASWVAMRNPVELALTIIHEAGHQVVASLLDLFALAHDQKAMVRSIYGQQRPVYAVLHAAVSFGREAQFAHRLTEMGHDQSGHWLIPALADYVREIGDLSARAVAIVDAHAALTDVGELVLSGVRKLVNG